ncbi:MAG: formate dehydrogenase accessory sulfurtransferase FdhD [bacterium]|nr:formate dehydrogenase accessory sulfurtransferase FdhD [bacterium]
MPTASSHRVAADPAELPRPRTTSTERVRALKVTGFDSDFGPDTVVVEEPLTVHVRHHGVDAVLGSTMRTPGHDLELAVGLAVAEGVVTRSADVSAVRQCRPGGRGSTNDVVIELDDEVRLDPTQLGRVSHPSSACGMCGRDQIDDLISRVGAVARDVRIDVGVLAGLPDAMSDQQSVFRRTGGLHAAALARADGTILVVREDVGRHNAVDKAIGQGLLDGVRCDVLVVSGRAGFEIVQKAAAAGIPIVASVSAPTSLSVDAAKEAGITLAAFVRGSTMTVYSGEHRLVGLGEPSSW